MWKWWEEEKPSDGSKWRFLEHKGVMFPPEYEPLPDHVAFKYDGQKIQLSPDAEEIAGFYARMLEVRRDILGGGMRGGDVSSGSFVRVGS